MDSSTLSAINGNTVSVLPVDFAGTPTTVSATWNAIECKCGNCGRKIGEFYTVWGKVKCKKCGSVNLVRR